MGSRVSSSSWTRLTERSSELAGDASEADSDKASSAKLGEVLSGRIPAIDIDSVEAVRETREQK